MGKKIINWLTEAVDALNKAESEKKISHIDDYVTEVLAFKGLPLSWDNTAVEVNRILGLKGMDKVSGKRLARIAAKWKAAGMIDLAKVDAFHAQVSKTLEVQSHGQPKAAPPIQPSTIPQAVPAASQQSATFADAKEFAQAIVNRFPGLKHDTGTVQKSFETNKGKDKEAMLKAYRDALGG